MKLFLSTDFEGTSGVVAWEQIIEGNPEYEQGRQLLIDTFWRGARYSERHWTIHRVIAAGDMVAVQASMQGRLNEGASYDNDYVYLFRFAGPKIVEVWEYLDTAYFFERRESTA